MPFEREKKYMKAQTYVQSRSLNRRLSINPTFPAYNLKIASDSVSKLICSLFWRVTINSVSKRIFSNSKLRNENNENVIWILDYVYVISPLEKTGTLSFDQLPNQTKNKRTLK